ncbi:GTP-binding protein [Ancylomarina euxinus]|uniref:GTP-binding protein n=1 Tax=Ancylomarina euxinus TaxID=2283627 RepID=A0A425Y0I6_9BACT|nr:GTP-binding protein [Ancylomarina euxinus]MCZ4695336.1 GTP-binding protein [Ancylomarina euxinus]MUP15531.1 GTP-binding protein [Ancylomarina euxinus]RRG21024.1 GTP-binding protein [Ancylomarina euxinus]
MSKIPVTVITGFLGAGKTSLLNQLIQNHKEKKFVIIENEFGEENIDSEFVANIGNEDLFELSNGCICCNLNTELFMVLENLIISNHSFNHLLIETTGIADPGNILASFISDPGIKAKFELDSVICLIDAANADHDLKNEDVLNKQIAVSDTLILNKVDLSNEEAIKKLCSKIKEINPTADIHQAVQSKLNVKLLDVYAYNPKHIYQFLFSVDGIGSNSKKHDHSIENYCFKSKLAFNQMKLASWLDAFLQFNSDTIYRVKGILNITGVENKILLQSVHTQIQATVGGTWEDSESRESKLVFIGKHLNTEVIEKNLIELCD